MPPSPGCGFAGQIKPYLPIFPLLVGAIDGAGEGATTTIKFTPKAVFGFGNDGRGRGERGIMVGGASMGGNEKEEVKSS